MKTRRFAVIQKSLTDYRREYTLSTGRLLFRQRKLIDYVRKSPIIQRKLTEYAV